MQGARKPEQDGQGKTNVNNPREWSAAKLTLNYELNPVLFIW